MSNLPMTMECHGSMHYKHMMKTKDLTGQTFGRWKVLYQVEDHITPK